MTYETVILIDFFGLMLKEFEGEDIKDYIKDEELDVKKLNPIIQKWINEGVDYDDEEVKERIFKTLIKKHKKHKVIIKHDEPWLWLNYSPKVLKTK